MARPFRGRGNGYALARDLGPTKSWCWKSPRSRTWPPTSISTSRASSTSDHGRGEEDDLSSMVAATTTTPMSQPGDLWVLGVHRLLCGDACQVQSYAQLLAGEPAQMVFTDPPYNVAVDGHV